jgi:hypothetical protein
MQLPGLGKVPGGPVALLLVAWLWAVPSCAPQQQELPPGWAYLFAPDGTGLLDWLTQLPVPADTVVARYGTEPYYEDSMGVVYRIDRLANGPEKSSLDISFYVARNAQPAAYQSVVLNFYLGDEQAARTLLEALAERLNRRFGVPEGGSYGDYTWRRDAQPFHADLRFENEQRDLVLNLYLANPPSGTAR